MSQVLSNILSHFELDLIITKTVNLMHEIEDRKIKIKVDTKVNDAIITSNLRYKYDDDNIIHVLVD